jgi:SAM-dependent methyltransferase
MMDAADGCLAGRELLLTREWPAPSDNPKSKTLLRRRERFARKLHRYRADLEMVLRLIGPRPLRVLDVACGTGFRVLELAQHGHAAFGVDIDPNLCRLANGAATHFGVPATLVCGDACRVPLADASFDVVMSNSFFEHVYDVDVALSEQLRLLKPGGLLIIEDGNLLNPVLLFDLLVLYPLRTRGQYGGLKWLFTKSQVKRNLYGYLPLGRDEDLKTMWWWDRKLRARTDVELVESVTTGKYQKHWIPGPFYPLRGSCLVIARRPHA